MRMLITDAALSKVIYIFQALFDTINDELLISKFKYYGYEL